MLICIACGNAPEKVAGQRATVKAEMGGKAILRLSRLDYPLAKTGSTGLAIFPISWVQYILQYKFFALLLSSPLWL